MDGGADVINVGINLLLCTDVKNGRITMSRKLITIVVPVYKEEKNLSNLLVSLNSVTSSISDIDWEYIFVNDGSPDSSITVLKQLAARQNNSPARIAVQKFRFHPNALPGLHWDWTG